MPNRRQAPRPGVYNTPTIRNGGFGYLQVEAINNRPMSIARRHLAASVLRMRAIEPDELTSSDWVQFLVMEDRERERWMTGFIQRRRNSDESTSSAENDRDIAYDKAEEARQEAEDAARELHRAQPPPPPAVTSPAAPSASTSSTRPGTTPSISLWARQFDEGGGDGESPYSARRPRHVRRAVNEGDVEAPPTYESAVRARTPPPAYEPRSDDEGPTSPASPRRIRFDV